VVIAGINRVLLNSMPDWLLFFVIVGAVLAASLLGLLLTRRYLGGLRDAADAGTVVAITAIAMTLFAFVLAFAVVTLYDQFNAARDSVTGEASDFAQIVRDSHNFPERNKKDIERAIRRYILEVRNREFHLMRDGHDDPVASDRFNDVFHAVQSYDPRTQAQVAFYGSVVSQLNDAVSQRRARRTLINASLPRAYTTLIFLTAIVSIVTTFFVVTHSRRLEDVLVVFVAIIVGAGLLAALLLQYPFSGSVAVSSKPFVEGVLQCVVAPELSTQRCDL
jgi:uncharacterized membrane protein